MNINQTDLLFQMMQMANQMAQATFPAGGSASETGKSDFQSFLEKKRMESDLTTEKGPASPESSQAQEPENSGQTEAEETQEVQEPAAEAWKLGLLAYAGQLNIQPDPVEVALEGDISQTMAVVPAGTETVSEPSVEAMTVTMEPAIVTEQAVQTDAPLETDTAQVQQPRNAEPHTSAETDMLQTPATEVVMDSRNAARAQTDTDRQPDTQEDGRAQAEVQVDAWQSPLFHETEHMPIKVGDNAALDTTAPEFDNQLAGTLDTALTDGTQRLELKLTPENLGNVVVEMTRNSDGVLHIVLRAESEQAAKLLSDHSSTLGLLLQNSTQSEVRVEVPQPQQSEQQAWKQPDQNSGQQNSGGRSQQQHREERNTDDFLSQLRLGLLETMLE